MLIVFSMVLNIACAKRFGTDNPSITEVSGTLDSYLVLAANTAFEHSHHLNSTCHHCLTLKPHDWVKFLIKIALPLLKRIKLNVMRSSSVFCSSIIIFIRLFVLSSLSQMLDSYNQMFLFLISYHCFFCTENSQLLHVVLNSAYMHVAIILNN